MLADLERTDIIFSEPHVDRACAFIEALVHIKGEWAGQPVKLEPFQVWIIASIFGFLNAKTRLRKVRNAFILLPRKNGKSLLAAGIALYMTFADNEPGAEGYCGASNLSQANEVFNPAKRMAELSPGFMEAFGVEVMAKSIFSEDSGSKFVPVIAKTKDGSSPHVAICDELHQAKDATQIQAFRTGMGARRQPLLLVISTAGFHLAGICRTEQLDAEAVLKGTSADDRLFSAIYTIDPEDNWRDFSVWRKANPNLGVSVSEEYLRGEYEKALQSPANQAFARTKYLNQWVASANGWLNQVDWANSGSDTLDMAALKGRKAFIGVDMSTRQDLTAIVVVVPLPTHGQRAIFPFAFVPRGAVDDSPNAPAYASWVQNGDLIVTEGSASSFVEIEAKIEELCKHFAVEEIVFDNWQGENTRQKFEKLGLNTSVFVSNSSEWTVAMDDFEAALKNGELFHPNNPVFDWCAANVCAAQNGVSRRPVKPSKSGAEKIDLIVSALYAFAASNKAPVVKKVPQLFFV
ncbi:terminase large subunit [Sphingomonas sp. Leaf242]|uniref:terminase large subunit n=1 Tax=Sphingomonas sp. Leaf242 TaxID=1736304 RepID=UPI000B195867|nr:terminase TerL endonuclease subunit [Sphingomonas sp. Leaf242]